MKKLLSILAVILLSLPSIASANIPVAWNATSSDAGFVRPNAVNGNNPLLSILATGTSTIAGNLSIVGNLQAGSIIAPVVLSTSTVAITGTGNCLTADATTLVVDCTNHRVGITMNLATNMAYPLQIESGISGGNSTLMFIHNGGGAVNSISSIGFGVFGANNNTENGRIGVIRTNRAVSADSDMLFSTYSNNVLAEKMRIMDNGNVGIGTSTPASKLDVSSGVSGSQNITIEKANSGNANENGGTLLFDNYGPANTAHAATTVNGTILFRSSGPTSGILQNAAQIQAIADLQQTGSIVPTALTFWTSSFSTGILAEGMRLTNMGLFGIGTTTPFGKLSVSQASTGAVPWVDFASTTGAISQSVYRIDSAGHRTSSTTAPTLSSGVVDGTDQRGRVIGASSGVVITFNQAFPRTPSCIVTPEAGSITSTFSYAATASTLTVTEVGLGTFDYSCGIGAD